MFGIQNWSQRPQDIESRYRKSRFGARSTVRMATLSSQFLEMKKPRKISLVSSKNFTPYPYKPWGALAFWSSRLSRKVIFETNQNYSSNCTFVQANFFRIGTNLGYICSLFSIPMIFTFSSHSWIQQLTDGWGTFKIRLLKITFRDNLELVKVIAHQVLYGRKTTLKVTFCMDNFWK